MRTLRSGLFGMAVALVPVLGGCATTDQPYDPIEPINRFFFDINQRLDRNAALPVATYYADNVPDPMRAHLHNLLLNLGGPVTTANYLLQGEFGFASEALQRFVINSTVGVVGIFDVATDWGIPQRNRDFGETLGELGIPNGPYLVIPLEGSSALRDFAGSYVDGYFSPLRYVGEYNGRPYVGMFRNVLGSVDNRSANIETYRDIERTSVDFYATMRSMYLQRRARLVANKEVVTADLPDF